MIDAQINKLHDDSPCHAEECAGIKLLTRVHLDVGAGATLSKQFAPRHLHTHVNKTPQCGLTRPSNITLRERTQKINYELLNCRFFTDCK